MTVEEYLKWVETNGNPDTWMYAYIAHFHPNLGKMMPLSDQTTQRRKLLMTTDFGSKEAEMFKTGYFAARKRAAGSIYDFVKNFEEALGTEVLKEFGE